MCKNIHNIRKGFTLVELLIVITIIGILASLAAVGVNAVRRTAAQASIKTQMSEISAALETYKSNYSEYPPSLADRNATMRHVSNRWMRAGGLKYKDVLYAAGVSQGDIDELIDANDLITESLKNDPRWGLIHMVSLRFWLSGPYDATRGKSLGFAADLSNPLNLTASQRQDPIYPLDEKKVFEMNAKNGILYGMNIRNEPIVYFRGSKSAGYGSAADLATIAKVDLGDSGVAIPYAKNLILNDDGSIREIVWYENDKFQLVHPGLDKKFSGTRASVLVWFTGQSDVEGVSNGITSADLDNATNFTDTATLDSLVKQ